MGINTPARDYFPGMGQAVADRTVNRKIMTELQRRMIPEVLKLNPTDPLYDKWVSACQVTGHEYEDDHDAVFMALPPVLRDERWADVAARVAEGNASLHRGGPNEIAIEHDRMEHHLRQASLLMSGRHLQHGDKNQKKRPLEVFTNCSTAITRHRLFELLLSGSGVGSLYNDEIAEICDYNHMPIVVPVIRDDHPDVMSGEIQGFMTPKEAIERYISQEASFHKVGDSREGWGKGIELIDAHAFRKRRDLVLILDFSGVRPRGAPIRGMQNRPASGPGPLMNAIAKVAKLRDAGYDPWLAAMYADHYLAECVLVGGARRAARIAVKHWTDKTIFDFIGCKRGGDLWSANNSIGVDKRFWKGVEAVEATLRYLTIEKIEDMAERGTFDPLELHAWKVFQAATDAAYHDNTGEPGFINLHTLNDKREGIEAYIDGDFIDETRNPMYRETRELYRALAAKVLELEYAFIVNPCGEIVLLALGGYCTIADVVPFFASDDDDAEDAFRTAVRALIRVNTMSSLYQREVARTNRIGVGITGLHEWIWKRFKLGFRDIIKPDPQGRIMKDANGNLMIAPTPQALEMWLTLSRFAAAVSDEAEKYAKEMGVVVPHTNRTIKPAGTTSKLFGLTEGAHLPAMREFLRWVQFRSDDPILNEYREKGYPVRELKQYTGTTIVGFPTQPMICTLGMGDKLVTASEATPEEQYRYLRLLETFWIRGVNRDLSLFEEDTGNQISYTLKYDPNVVSFKEFQKMILQHQSKVKCCSFMPKTDTTAYEYVPEQSLTKAEFDRIAQAITDTTREDIGLEHVDCGAGGCPIDFNEGEK